MKLEAIYIKNLDIYEVDISIPYGMNVFHDNKEITSGKFLTKEIDKFSSEKTIYKSFRVDCRTNEKITTEEYHKRLSDFLKHHNITTDSCGDLVFDSLDQEFAYRRELEYWKDERISEKTVENVPVKIRAEIVYSTNNQFIKCIKFLGQTHHNNDALYRYDRKSATGSIIHEIFNDLGMKFEKNIGYVDTKNKKIWSNSDHSGFRFLVAFGTYIFGENDRDRVSDTISNPVGKLEDLLDIYENDKKWFSDRIKQQYNLHFGEIDQNKLNGIMIISDVHGQLALIKTELTSISVRGEMNNTKKRRCINKINDITNKIDKIFNDKPQV